jgi:hypothetical protein
MPFTTSLLLTLTTPFILSAHTSSSTVLVTLVTGAFLNLAHTSNLKNPKKLKKP